MTAFADILAQARLPEATVTLCLRGDLAAEWGDLERQLADASTSAPSLAERSPARIIAEQMEDLRARMVASAVTIRLRALPAPVWGQLYAERPIRAKDSGESEQAWRDRWYAWVADLVSRCAIDPVMTVEEVGQLVDVLSGVQWDELSNAAWLLNERKVEIPFSAAVSALTQDSAAK